MIPLSSPRKAGSSTSSSYSGGDMSSSISGLLQWFSRRPLLALLVFALCILLGSVFVPFLILDYFSGSFAPAGPSGPNQLFAARAGVLRHNLREALGLQGQFDQLAEHNEAYARSARRDRSEEPLEPGSANPEDLAQIALDRDRRRAKQAEIAAHEARFHPLGRDGDADEKAKEQQEAQQHRQQQDALGAKAVQERDRRLEELRRRKMGQPAPSPTPATPAASTPAAPDSPATSTQTTPGSPAASSNPEHGAQPERAAAVVAAFKHAYSAYEQSCFGQDDLHPLSKRCSNWLHAGLTIVDSLSTMMLMNGDGALQGELDRARNWVASSLQFGKYPGAVSFFETVIRALGGLISAYDLSNDAVYLQKARELGEKLLPAFNTPSGHPRGQINLNTGVAHDTAWTGGAAMLAEVGTCQMEFAALSQRTGDPKFARAAQKPIDALDRQRPKDGLYPIFINVNTGAFTNNKITFGAMGDSFYEYLVKKWLLTGRKDAQLQRMYLESMDGMLRKLYTHTGVQHGDHWYLADLVGTHKDQKMDHLVCFVPGMLALGVSEGIVAGDDAKRHMDAAEKVMETCFKSYDLQPSKIGPEYMVFRPTLMPGEASYKLRPEMVESLFIMWRLTRNPQYREWGWQTFQAIERHCRVDKGGYSALLDVRRPEGREDRMESFFLAETLKYLYLLFEDDSKLAINGAAGEFFVFNTEAHPIRSWQE